MARQKPEGLTGQVTRPDRLPLACPQARYGADRAALQVRECPEVLCVQRRDVHYEVSNSIVAVPYARMRANRRGAIRYGLCHHIDGPGHKAVEWARWYG